MEEKEGLIFACVLDGKGGGSPLDWAGMENRDPGKGLLWAHMDIGDDMARTWLMEKSGIEETICEALMEEGVRPRLVETDRGILLILRGVNCNPGEEAEDMVSLRIWLEENRIFTMRQRRVMAVDDVRKAVESGNGPLSLNDFLITVMEGLTERMKDVVDEIDDKVDEIDDEVPTADIQETRSAMARLRHRSIRLRRYISPQREVLIRFQRNRLLKFDEEERGRLRETVERTARFIEDIDHARDRAVIIGEELNNRVTETINRTMYRLSIVAVIFLPLNLLTSLLGINVGGIPGAANEAAFSIVSLTLIFIAFLLYVIFKRINWL